MLLYSRLSDMISGHVLFAAGSIAARIVVDCMLWARRPQQYSVNAEFARGVQCVASCGRLRGIIKAMYVIQTMASAMQQRYDAHMATQLVGVVGV